MTTTTTTATINATAPKDVLTCIPSHHAHTNLFFSHFSTRQTHTQTDKDDSIIAALAIHENER